jgi:endonuclease I/V8-like Glu-specific endopeptidase
VDDPERVQKRLARLGADWSLAMAVEGTPARPSTGRSLDAELEPASFGADVLGLERLMGRNDLVDVGFLERGYLAGRSVGRIAVGPPEAHYGTGFMISPRLLLTNNHVLQSAEEAGRAHVEFNFQSGLDGRSLPPVAFVLRPDLFFATSRELDFSVVAVADQNESGIALSGFGWLRMIEQEGKAIKGELVNIIQHPNGEPKQLALRENRIVDVLEQYLQYETDTAPGSSGSPVFNDQWEVVALHHSGVPLKDDEGHYLAIDGTVWTRDMGEQRLAWKANEGVRISRVLQALRDQALTGAPDALRAQVFAAGPARGPVPAEQSSGTATPVTVAAPPGLPITVTISVGTPAAGAAAVAPPQPELQDAPDVVAALRNVEAAQDLPYYDEPADAAARETYYEGIDADGAPEALYTALHELLDATHTPRPAYSPSRLVYPWVDLHEDRLIHSIYSDQTFSPEELIRADAGIELARTERLQELVLRESAVGPNTLEAEFDALEATLPYNCEHVVPQSWFQKNEPMRGDLHHLFACESGCNSFRGNFPYTDFPDSDEAIREQCGHRESDGFEPGAGKGPIARATLYFLLRYPGLVGDPPQELTAARLDMLLDWHRSNPVGEYERHRNAAIALLQGNRNPLVDHEAWAERIDFSTAWVGA